jgi:hypothetical protein
VPVAVGVPVAAAGGCAVEQHPDQPERQQHRAADDQRRRELRLDVAQVHVGQRDPQHRATKQDQQHGLHFPVHRDPLTTATRR